MKVARQVISNMFKQASRMLSREEKLELSQCRAKWLADEAGRFPKDPQRIIYDIARYLVLNAKVLL